MKKSKKKKQEPEAEDAKDSVYDEQGYNIEEVYDQ